MNLRFFFVASLGAPLANTMLMLKSSWRLSLVVAFSLCCLGCQIEAQTPEDAGGSTDDSGAMPTDSGSTLTDAGFASNDAGVSLNDAGEPDAGTTRDAGLSRDAGSLECPFVPVSNTLVPGSSAPTCASNRYTMTTLTYTQSPTPQLLDLYVPIGADAGAPLATIIWIHGGGWTSGSRADSVQPLFLVCEGFAVASIDYRLSGEAKFPAQIHDVKAAIRYLRVNATTRGLDPTRFVTFGSSAGGHLAALAGTSGEVSDLEDLTQGNAGVSSTVQAVVDWFGPTQFSLMDSQAVANGCTRAPIRHNDATSPESQLLGCTIGDGGTACDAAILRASPLSYVDRTDPPFFIAHGTKDCTVPPGQGAILRDALFTDGCVIHSAVSDAGHGGPQWTTVEVQQATLSFLRQVFR